MKQLVLKHRPLPSHEARARVGRDLAPGAGLVIAGVASLTMWAMIVGIAAIV